MMKLPGFTAEASLSKASENFKTDGTNAGSAGAQAVIPQFCVNSPCVFHKRVRCCASLFGGVKCTVQSC